MELNTPASRWPCVVTSGCHRGSHYRHWDTDTDRGARRQTEYWTVLCGYLPTCDRERKMWWLQQLFIPTPATPPTQLRPSRAILNVNGGNFHNFCCHWKPIHLGCAATLPTLGRGVRWPGIIWGLWDILQNIPTLHSLLSHDYWSHECDLLKLIQFCFTSSLR